MASPGKKHRDARSGTQQGTLERFQTIIRRVVSKDDERSSLVDDIACVVGAEILEGLRHPGSDLNSVELSRRFRTSRTPTREAVVILESLALRSLRLRRLTLSTPGRSHRSLADHVRLVGALEDRDGELASALIKANVLGALKLLEQLLADDTPDAKAESE